MTMLVADSRFRTRSLWIAIALVGAIATAFWTGSRYPRLEEKAQMAGIVPVEGPLTFESVFAVDPDTALAVRVLQTSVNWARENLQGMIFGLLFAAALLTVAAFVRRRYDPGAVGATLLGVVIGTPLGVCVNCAAPIARGLHAAGVRLETTLAALVSSPTLNVVVLTMAFSLFPLYVVMVKLAVTVAFLLIAVPIIARLSRSDLAPAEAAPAVMSASAPPLLAVDNASPITGWPGAAWAVLRTFARNLLWIVRRTVPLMLLAALIGAFIVEVVPWQLVVSLGAGITHSLTLVLMGALAVFGLILPVPIAFDVVIASALMQAGLPVRYVMPLLFTLGSFSVYSFLILWRGVSRRAALWCAVVLAGLGVLSGVAAHQLQKWERSRLQVQIFSELDRITTPATYVSAHPARGYDPAEVDAARIRAPLSFTRVTDLSVPGIIIETATDVPRTGDGNGNRGFVMKGSEDTGLVVSPLFDGEDFLEPFTYSAGLAAGDVHGDGHVDVLVPVHGALILFANRGNAEFVQQRIDAPALAGRHLMNAALVDLDNDGWLDIVASGWGAGLWWLRNREGQFDGRDLKTIDNRGGNFTAALGFADLDRDGDLDAVLGNWHAALDIPPESARNWILRNDGGAFRYEPLSDMTGETLTTLITDLDGDGWLDLVVGNDYGVSDLVYVGDGRGGLLDRSRAGEMFPITARNTMSIDSADLDNDGRLEILIADIALGNGTESFNPGSRPAGDACALIRESDHRAHCERLVRIPMIFFASNASESTETMRFAGEVQNCMRARDDRDRLICIGHNLLSQVTHVEGDPRRCAELPATLPRFRDMCERSFPAPLKIARPADANAIPQSHFYNVLLERDGGGTWVDGAKSRGLGVTLWTWNAKFTDFDLDGWQDLYAATGLALAPGWESNLFFRNDGTGHFHEATAEAGLIDYLATSAYVVADFDGDGDPDIVTRPMLGPLRLFENQAPAASARAASFEIRDMRGNHFGIGTTLTAHLDDSTLQMREIKASGGYQSFDPAEARFGLGTRSAIAHVDVRWSTGERTRLEGPFPAGARYRITRTGARGTQQ
jgi:uncharacterized membrane protein YraQ (UPF0718 family)